MDFKIRKNSILRNENGFHWVVREVFPLSVDMSCEAYRLEQLIWKEDVVNFSAKSLSNENGWWRVKY